HLQRLRTGAKRGQSQTSRWTTRGRILIPPPKARGNGPRLCAEHQPQRHGEATRFGIIRRLWASALAAAGPSDTAAVRWWFQDAPPGALRMGARPEESGMNSWDGDRTIGISISAVQESRPRIPGSRRSRIRTPNRPA